MEYFRKLSNFCLVLALLAGLLGLAQPAQAEAPLMADMWVTNGTVRTTLLSGNTLYIGGNFTYIGPPTGGFVALDAGGGPDMGFPPVNGSIRAIVPDGAGGWYVGGSFTKIGGHPCSNLAHIKADKSLDFAWCPNANYDVNALVIAPGNTIYVAGVFTNIGGQPRTYIAALDASTGLATNWNPDVNGIVYTLAIAPPLSGESSSTIYAGGGFTRIGGQNRNNLAALDSETGLATPWDPNVDRTVWTLAIAPPTSGAESPILGMSGSTIYAGGWFTNAGGQTRNYIAALDAGTGLATAWDPNASAKVSTLAVSADGSTIYTGGDFTSIGGQTRNHVAALDAGTGLATTWDPNADQAVDVLAVAPSISGTSGNAIYAGGWFSKIGGQSRNYIAALDAGTGLATTWNPNANAAVRTLMVAPPISEAVPPVLGASGNTIYAGGEFTSIGGLTRNNVAALDVSTGVATSWNPNANNYVFSLAAASPTSGIAPSISGASGNTIYAGGSFTSIGGQIRNHIAALDAGTGSATAWDPNASTGVGDAVLALVVAPPIPGAESPTSGIAPGGTIYAGGDFASIGGQNRRNIAALDPDTGLATSWNPEAYGSVSALALSDSTIYAGGYFTTIGGQTRYHIAALDASTGVVTAWNPNADNNVLSLALSGSTLYVGGEFTNIGGRPRNRIAALNASTGNATDWDPYVITNTGGGVYALAVAPGGAVYAAGSFIGIGGLSRNNIAALNAGTGRATTWNPNANFSAYALTVGSPAAGTSGSTIYAGGAFTRIGARLNSGIAALRDGAATCQRADSGSSWQVSYWSNCGNAIPGDGDSVEVLPGQTILLYGSLAANNLTINTGGELNLPAGTILSVENTLTNHGLLTQSQPVSATTIFLNIKNMAGSVSKYFGVLLTPSGNMGYTTVTIRDTQCSVTAPGDVLVNRCFDIAPTTPRNATVRFYYSYADLNGQTYNLLKLWRQRGLSWLQIAPPYNSSPACVTGERRCWLEAYNVSVYSTFVLGSQVHAVTFAPLLQR